MMLSNEGVALRVPFSYQADYLKAEAEYTKVAHNQFDEAMLYDALPKIAYWRSQTLKQRKEFYEHWLRTGTLLSPEDTSV